MVYRAARKLHCVRNAPKLCPSTAKAPIVESTLIHTGRSQFLRANLHFARALMHASAHCEIHAWEDIYDTAGLKLWARGKRVDAHLLERLSNRTLRKPIELCVHAREPIPGHVADLIEAQIAHAPDLALAVAPQAARLLRVVRNLVLNPTELLLLQVLRFAEGDRLAHAARVLALALAQFDADVSEFEWMQTTAHAALLHDIGELYLPPAPASTTELSNARQHPVIGARVATELARCPAQVGRQIELSHERLDGSGYPNALQGRRVPAYAHALLFAEAIADIVAGNNGLRRASVRTRLRPGAFAANMVDGLMPLAQLQPVAVEANILSASEVGARLRELHGQLGRVVVLVKLPFLETEAVRAAAAQWFDFVGPLMWALRASGVEDALAMGITLAPNDAGERIELAALLEQVIDNRDELRERVNRFAHDEPQVPPSRLVVELQEILNTPDAAASSVQ